MNKLLRVHGRLFGLQAIGNRGRQTQIAQQRRLPRAYHFVQTMLVVSPMIVFGCPRWNLVYLRHILKKVGPCFHRHRSVCSLPSRRQRSGQGDGRRIPRQNCTKLLVLVGCFISKDFGTPGDVDTLAANNIGNGEGGLTLLGVQVVLVRFHAPCESYTKKKGVAVNKK